MKRQPNSVAPVWVAHTCGFCGRKGGQYLSHYDVLRCSCGKWFWVLQPIRRGPFAIFPHPSLNQANRESVIGKATK